jgi:hypothetical protein
LPGGIGTPGSLKACVCPLTCSPRASSEIALNERETLSKSGPGSLRENHEEQPITVSLARSDSYGYLNVVAGASNVDLELIFGAEGSEPKTMLQLRVQAGGDAVESLQGELGDELGASIETLTPYLVFKCADADKAAGFAEFVKQQYEGAKERAQEGPGYMEDLPGFGLAMLGALGSPDMVSLSVEQNNDLVYIKATIGEEQKGMVMGMVAMAHAQLGEGLTEKTSVTLDFETGASISEFLSQEDSVQTLFRYLKVYVMGNVSKGLMSSLINLSPAPGKVKKAAKGILSLAEESTVKLRFNDLANLPEALQAELKATSGQAKMGLKGLASMVGAKNKEIIQGSHEHQVQGLRIMVLGEKATVKVTLKLPGLHALLE